MIERISSYTPTEQSELWDSWANRLAIENPKLAEEVVRLIIEGEEYGTN